MIYHDLDELNMIIVEMNTLCSDYGISLQVYPKKDYFCYKLTDGLNEDFICGHGFIYQYEKHSNPFLEEIDRMIFKQDRKNMNYIKDKKYKYGDIMTRNEYLCYECNMSDLFYVCKTQDFLDTFCLHSDYLKDEVFSSVDE